MSGQKITAALARPRGATKKASIMPSPVGMTTLRSTIPPVGPVPLVAQAASVVASPSTAKRRRLSSSAAGSME